MKKRFCILTLLAVICLTLFPVSQSAINAEATHHQHFSKVHKYKATIAAISDGDTVRLEEEVLGTKKVRLLSIDCPETHFQGESQDPWGQDATDFLVNELPVGTEVTLEVGTETHDHYGRLLAHIWKGKTDINKLLVEAGQAVTYFIYPNIKYMDEYQAAYLKAKKAHLGMWSKKNSCEEMPFEFRARVAGKDNAKYVGNIETKTAVSPKDYNDIPIEKRLFFMKKSDIAKAGYELQSEDEQEK